MAEGSVDPVKGDIAKGWAERSAAKVLVGSDGRGRVCDGELS